MGAVGYLAYRSGYQAVESAGNQLTQAVSDRINDRLDTYLQTPQQVLVRASREIKQTQANLQGNLQGNRRSLAPWETQFRSQLQHVQSPLTLSWISLEGPALEVWKDAQGRIQASRVQSRSLPVDLPHTVQTPAKQPVDRPAWISIEVSQSQRSAVLTAVLPVYQQGQLQGVLTADVPLSELHRLLSDLMIPAQGRAFILSRSGNLVATSSLSTIERSASDSPEAAHRPPSDRPDEVTRRTLQHLLAQWPHLTQTPDRQTLHLRQESVFGAIEQSELWITVTPYRSQAKLPWWIVVVLPASEMTTRIDTSLQRTILWGGMALLGTIGLGIYTTQWITKPVLILRNAAQRFAQGEFQPALPTPPITELRDLTHSFNEMAQQLHHSFGLLQDLNAQLLESKAWLAKFLDALPVGVGIHVPDGSATYFNQAAKRLLGTDTIPNTAIPELAAAYRLYVAGTDRLYPIEQLPAVRALNGEAVRLEDLEIRRPDGRSVVEAWATPIRDSAGQITYAIVAFQDITSRKQADRILEQYNRELESEVWKRTQALETEIQDHQKTEATLRENQARFDTLAAAVPGVLYSYISRVDGSSAFEYVSRAVESVFEMPIAKILENPEAVILGQMHPDDRSGYLAAVAHSAVTLGQFFYEWRTFAPSGKLIWLQANSQPERRSNGDICWHGIVLDVSERKAIEAERQRAEEALRHSEERFRNLFENAPVAYQSLDDNGFYIDVNPEFCKLLGYSREELLGHHFAEFWAPSIRPRFLKDFGCFKKTGYTRAELQLLRKNHVQITVLLEGRVQRDAGGQFVKTHCILYNITKRKQMEEALRRADTKLRQANQELERLVNTDALTQVANRRYFDRYLLQEWRRSAREQQPLSLILFDVDYFKRFNDTYGHQAGDHCLRQVSWAAQQAIQRSSDLVARYGGEEFAVILPNTNTEGAIVVVEQIRQRIRSLAIPHGASEVSAWVTVSAGISTIVPPPNTEPTALIQTADEALYAAKQSGRDRYVTWLPSNG